MSMAFDNMSKCLTSLYFDGMFARRDQVNTALPNTYQWIWDNSKYKDWYSAEGTDKSSILWVQGKPGSGKYTLAKMIRKSLGWAMSRSMEKTPSSWRRRTALSASLVNWNVRGKELRSDGLRCLSLWMSKWLLQGLHRSRD